MRIKWQFAIASVAIILGVGLVSLRVVALEPPRTADQATAPREASSPAPDDAAETKQAVSAPAEDGKIQGIGPLAGTVVDPLGQVVADARVLLSQVQENGTTLLLQET